MFSSRDAYENDFCPVRDELLGEMYRANENGLPPASGFSQLIHGRAEDGILCFKSFEALLYRNVCGRCCCWDGLFDHYVAVFDICSHHKLHMCSSAGAVGVQFDEFQKQLLASILVVLGLGFDFYTAAPDIAGFGKVISCIHLQFFCLW